MRAIVRLDCRHEHIVPAEHAGKPGDPWPCWSSCDLVPTSNQPRTRRVVEVCPWPEIGDRVTWTSSTTGQAHAGEVVAVNGGPDGERALVRPDGRNLDWTAWEDYAALTLEVPA